MPKFICPRNVEKAEGYVEFYVIADNADEAIAKFESGGADIHASEVDVVEFSDFDFGEMHELK